MFLGKINFKGKGLIKLKPFLIILLGFIVSTKNVVGADVTLGEGHTSLVLYKPTPTVRQFLESFYEEKAKESFRLQIAERRLIPSYHEPLPRSLIIMYGVTSSGKSSLAQEFVDHNFAAIFISMRTVCIEIARDFFLRKKRTGFEIVYDVVGDSFFGLLGINRDSPLMRKILEGIKNREEFLSALEQLEKIYDRSIFKDINKAMLQKAMPFLCLGCSVIFDRISYEDGLEIFEEIRPIRVLTYCSLPQLMKRAQERSFKAFLRKDCNEYRPCISTCSNFAAFFRPKRREDKGTSLENLSNRQFLAQIEEAYTLSVPYLDSDFTPTEFISFKERMLRDMGLHKNDTVKVYPRDEVDLILDTTRLSLKESLLHLLKSVNFIRALPSKMVFAYPLTSKALLRYIES